MGRVTVEFVLSNYADMKLLEAGYLTPDRVRRVTMNGVIDTGTTRLVLPQGVCDMLGLPMTGQSVLRYADHRREKRNVVSDAHVAFLGRGGVFNAIVEPTRSDALIGAIVMEDLDMIVDCPGQKVVPRESDSILTEVE